MEGRRKHRVVTSAWGLLGALASAFVVAVPARAMNLGQDIQIHGAGSWHYARNSTDGYVYSGSSSDGNYTNVDAILNVSATPTDQLMIVLQPHWQLKEVRTFTPSPAPPPPLVLETGPEFKAEIDFAFAEWKFADELRFRAGQVKLPFGIYNEISNIGTLRPFIMLPQGIYGNQGVVAEAYQGAGLTGRLELNDAWALQYDLYGGQIVSDLDVFPTVPFTLTASDVMGGRLVLYTPVEGLNFGVSGYLALRSGITTTDGEDLYSVGAHVDYTNDFLTAKAEVVHPHWDNVADVITGYGEVGVMVLDGVQLAGRFDFYKSDLLDPTLAASLPATIDKHIDVGAGVNYWFNNYFVLKAAYHYIWGNRFSQPEMLLSDFVTPYDPVTNPLYNPPIDDTNHMVEVGAQFSF